MGMLQGWTVGCRVVVTSLSVDRNRSAGAGPPTARRTDHVTDHVTTVDCVTVSVIHHAAFEAPVDDSCTRRGSEWRPLLGKAEQRIVIGAIGILSDF